jgi:uncharacterized protein YjbJ (UPF0337 family)
LNGAIKQTAGQATKNPGLDADSKTGTILGTIHNFAGKLEKAVGI